MDIPTWAINSICGFNHTGNPGFGYARGTLEMAGTCTTTTKIKIKSFQCDRAFLSTFKIVHWQMQIFTHWHLAHNHWYTTHFFVQLLPCGLRLNAKPSLLLKASMDLQPRICNQEWMTFTNSYSLMVTEEGNILLICQEGERIMIFSGELKQKTHVECIVKEWQSDLIIEEVPGSWSIIFYDLPISRLIFCQSLSLSPFCASQILILVMLKGFSWL